MKKNKTTKLTGFTLLEMIITVAIIGILASITVISFTSSRNEVRVKAAQAEVAASIKLAHSYALQGRADGGTTPSYYGIRFFSSTNYALCGCSNSTCSDCAYASAEEKYSLQNGVVLHSPSLANAWVTFSIPNGRVQTGSGMFTIRSSDGSQTKGISVNSNGYVTEH